MAEMMTPQKDGRRKAHSLRVDLTPMVDLGFLLISFFMLTTTMAQPKTMAVNVPDNSETTQGGTAFPEEATITLIPAADHKCYYYEGVLKSASDMHSTSTTGVREVLNNKEARVAALPDSYSKQAHKLHVLIKPADNSKYEDVVHLLDEMNILAVQFYTIADITQEELAMTASK